MWPGITAASSCLSLSHQSSFCQSIPFRECARAGNAQWRPGLRKHHQGQEVLAVEDCPPPFCSSFCSLRLNISHWCLLWSYQTIRKTSFICLWVFITQKLFLQYSGGTKIRQLTFEIPPHTHLFQIRKLRLSATYLRLIFWSPAWNWLLAAFSDAWDGLKYVGFMPLLIE